MSKNKNQKNLIQKNLEFADDNELVTKGFMRGYVTNLIDSRFEEYDQKMRRYIGALMEDNQHRHEQLIESFKMQYEIFQRYTEGNEEDKEKINSRLSRLESKVLLA